MSPTVLTIRVWINGRMVDERSSLFGAKHPNDDIKAMAQDHGELVAYATDHDMPWMVELIFPDGEHVRIGDDPDGMVDPQPAATLATILDRYR